MDTQSSILDLFCWHSINWFRHCHYFKDQAPINCYPSGNNDFYLVYYSPRPQGDSFSFADIGDEVTSAFLALAYSGMLLSLPGLLKESLKRK